jgi:ATP-dependent Lhr-like helicase
MFSPILDKFHPVVRSWFSQTFGEPSPPQQQGWPSISAGEHTLIVAPTGSGKTLAAFLWCINHLVEENLSLPFEKQLPAVPTRLKRGSRPFNKHPSRGVRVIYISPLKALNNDIHRNLEIPLTGIVREAERQGVELEPIRSAVRTGDTTATERTRMIKRPPDILITTPESLYLMLTSEKSREMFRSVRYVIVDEIHAISTNKRGVHLSLSLERLEHFLHAVRRTEEGSFIRIGLSATQKPLDEVAAFLGGMDYRNNRTVPRAVRIIDAGYKKEMDLQVICAPRDFTSMTNDSAWVSIYPRLLDDIGKHTSTLIFVNNRRLAERLAAKLNEMLEGETDTTALYAVPFSTKKIEAKKVNAPFTVHAYHGSMSRHVRERLEKDLKQGRLRALVTTSALELGIDIGDVDLVIQIQSPKGIARGLQRVGRSGHLVSARSKGRIYATHREDLFESAVIARGMRAHAIERTSIPKNCLDVLAQQIVAMVGVEEWNVDDLYDRIRRSYCYATLTENIFVSVLEMLSGRYSHDAFRELRARIVWDKLHNTLTSLPGSSLLAITNAGTIPDKGYYGVYLEDRKTKIGEVDEEFIYESRTGDTFILGSSVWRMTEIDANRVVVQPAPGQPARMPFWRGEMIGRTHELSVAMGEATDMIASAGNDEVLRGAFPVDEHSVRNIVDYIREQQEATRYVPSHNRIVVEGFRDEVGDPRIVVHSRFGKGVNALLGLILHHDLQHRLGIEVQLLYNDDGILLRCSDVERLPLDLFSRIDISSAQQLIVDLLPSSPLFGAIFRQNAERALLLPKGRPGVRRPFFLQRLKAADLLQIVRQYSDFPIVIETMRECLNDVLDLEHFTALLTAIDAGKIDVSTIQTDTPSPFASSLLFDFTMVYMYEWDDPKRAPKELQSQLNRELLSEVVPIDTPKPILRTDAVSAVEEQLQFITRTRRARSTSEVMEMFLRLGELTENELSARVTSKECIGDVRSRGLMIPVRIGNDQYFIAAEEAPLYQSVAQIEDSIMSSLPDHIQNIRFAPEEALRYLVLRKLRSRGPLPAQRIAERFNRPIGEIESLLASVAEKESLVYGTLTESGGEPQWCYRPNLERMHRASINILRKEIKPATIGEFTQLLQQWQHRHPHSMLEGENGIRSIVDMMQGYAMPAELWESEILRHRIRYYDGSIVRSLASRGEIVCAGMESGKSQWIIRGDGYCYLREKEDSLEGISPASKRIYDFITANGASLFSDIREEMNLSLAALNRSIAQLFWRGLITNDIPDELLNLKRYRTSDESDSGNALSLPEERITIVNPRRNPLKNVAMRTARQALKNVPGWHGRWSLIHSRSILGPGISDEEKVRRQAEQLMVRYGIVAREIAKREEHSAPWPLIAMELQRMEMRGEIRRGYFVEGLSGMQFAHPDAVSMIETIKNARSGDAEPAVLNACDPANPYGSGIDLSIPQTGQIRAVRSPGNFVIIHRGVPVVWIENFCTRIFTVPLSESHQELIIVPDGLRQFINHCRTAYPHLREIVVEYCNNRRPTESEYADLLRSLGFYRDRVQTMRLDLR